MSASMKLYHYWRSSCSWRVRWASHCYVELGHLAKPDPQLVFEHYPDERRIFDIASLTKALVTTPLVHKMCKTHDLGFEAKVGDFYGVEDLDLKLQSLTIRSLLEHRSGLPAWRNFYVDVEGEDDAKSRLFERLNHTATQVDPQKTEVYSDVGFILLGYF